MNRPTADEIRYKSSSIHTPYASSPTRLGYRLPAEWETHEATWVSWPHRATTWACGLGPIGKFYRELIAAIAQDEPVRIHVRDAEMETRARAILASDRINSDRILFHHCATDDAWCRSYSAMIVKVAGNEPSLPQRLAVDWRFNGWGGKQNPSDRDNNVSHAMARTLNIQKVAGGMVLEAAAIDVNGAGAVLASRSAVLDANRNPDLPKEQIEQRLQEMLGVEQLFWLDGNPLVGDATNGHIDNVARFVNEHTIVAAIETDVQDANFVPLQINLDRLRSMRLRDSRALQIKTLPMPPALVRNGQRVPASYTQFYVTNGSVIVPEFGAPTDDIAKEVLGGCFPNRRVVGIDCRNVVERCGGLHHLTQQVAA